ncbi:TonB-dependent receptor domain-containing protein [Novosphingobium aquiterrae]|uniref:TonB-dependent receptor domain-containing protein n=1 Tax=Novosphingobium aquiterrae TaxID=624388 RepID=A0ABV6PJ65_9SPHN
MKKTTLTALKVGSAPLVLGLAFLSSAAFAQEASAVDCNANPNDAACAEDGQIVVTGTLFRRTDSDTPSPVTTVTTESLDQKGITTIQDGLQALAANNGPALTNSFSANGAFAAGASAVSLRGLSTNSTLVLFDGLRAAYYPLADDGSRNFVDLNTIPDDIVSEVQVLRDGASSAYGADAIAGVVNIITKRQFQGLQLRADAGVSSRGDAPTQRISLTAGFGDLEKNGINAYVSGFYYHSAKLMNKDRPYPFNTDDQSGVCRGGVCLEDNTTGADVSAGVPTAGQFLVRPYLPYTTNPPAGTAQGPWAILNPSCPGVVRTVSAAELTNNPTAPTSICAVDYTKNYGTIAPEVKRWGLSGRVTAKVTDSIEAYFEANFLQSTVSYTGFPSSAIAAANTGILYRQFSTSSAAATRAPGSLTLFLPVYVCPERVNCATSPNRVLNPNNPYAANGQVARIIGRDLDHVTYNETRNRAYRGAMGFSGDITDTIGFDVGMTAMHTDLRRNQSGYVYIQHLLDLVADGTYNWRNPAANSQAVNDYLYPANISNATSDQVEFKGALTAKLAELPGGPLQLGVGGSIRYEAVDAPSANDDYNGPTQRYFTLNAFGTKGSRWIQSAYYEAEAPIIDQLTLTGAGRYDHYSSGQSAFSPKFGFKFVPVKQLSVRGTWSKGFRIPSFGEANALPTTGFVSNTSSVFNNAYLLPYTVPGNTAGPGGTFTNCTTATFSTSACPVYIRGGSYGQTTLASPNLQPEKSTSWTLGMRFEPNRHFTFTVDYYRIKKTGVITQPSNAPALRAYYAGQPIPAGYTVIPDAPDLNNPTLTPRVAFVQSNLINANTQTVSGLDFTAEASFNLSDNIKWTSSLEASYIIKLDADLTNSGGGYERYDGTLGNFNLTAGSGTPKWHGSWLNSLDVGDHFQLNLNTNFFGGYNLSAMDQGTAYKDCIVGKAPDTDGTTYTGLSPFVDENGAATYCDVPNYVTFDLGVRVKVNDNFTLSANMNNVFDRMPPLDPVTYGAYLYNPVQGGNGIIGRFFKVGAKVNF